MIRVLIVEDSTAIQDFLTQVFRADDQFAVVGVTAVGERTVSLARHLRPEVIVVGTSYGSTGFVEITRQIMSEVPTPVVVLTRGDEGGSTDPSFDALQAGAITTIEMPPDPGDPRHTQAVNALLTTVRLMAEVKVVRRRPVAESSRKRDVRTASAVAPRTSSDEDRPLAVAIAASTGGPQALQTVLRAIGRDIDAPILVVQHIRHGFLDSLVGWLAETCPQPIRVATHGELPRGGTVYVAPDGAHLLLAADGTLALSMAAPVRGFRPSADVLFESVAERIGRRAVGVVLTGMGSDGATGLETLRAVGALTIAQDAATSVVYGMPGAAADNGAAVRVLPLAAIGPAIRLLFVRNTRGDTT